MYSCDFKMSDVVAEHFNNWTRVLSERQLMIDKQIADSMNDITCGAYERDEDICEEEEEW